MEILGWGQVFLGRAAPKREKVTELLDGVQDQCLSNQECEQAFEPVSVFR